MFQRKGFECFFFSSTEEEKNISCLSIHVLCAVRGRHLFLPDGSHGSVLIPNLLSILSLSSLEASPEAMGAVLGAVNGDSGSPSDDEDLPHQSSSSRGAYRPSPRGPDEGSRLVNGPCYYGDDSIWREPAEEDLLAVSLGCHTHRQVSLNDYLDTIEAPRSPGERPHAGPSPKLRSSFPTDTRLNAMLHIDSDEDEETAGQHRETPQEIRTQDSTDSALSQRRATSESPQGNEGSGRSGAGAGATAEAGSSARIQPGTEPGDEATEAQAGTSTAAEPAAGTGAARVTGEAPTSSSSQASGTDVQAAAAAGQVGAVGECTCQQQSSRMGANQELPCNISLGLLSPIQVSSCSLVAKCYVTLKSVGQNLFENLPLCSLFSPCVQRRWRPEKKWLRRRRRKGSPPAVRQMDQ